MIDDHLIPLRGGLFSLTLVQILPCGDQDVDALFYLRPFQTLLLSFGIGTQLDAAGIVVEEAITAILKRPALATSTVFLLQKGGSLFGAVMFSIVGRNTFFSVRKPAAGCQRCSPIRLGKRKSGDLFGLRSLVNLRDLLRLGGEETQL